MNALILALLVALPQAGSPQQPEPEGVPAVQAPSSHAETQLERDTRQLAAELRCPVCQGLSLQDSPAGLSQEMRSIIREQLLAGRTVAEVKQYFVDKYGEWILLQPEPRGFNLTVYIAPVVLLLGGAAFLYFTAKRWTQQGTEAAPAESGQGDRAAD